MGLLKAEQFTNLQQLQGKTTVFFTGVPSVQCTQKSALRDQTPQLAARWSLVCVGTVLAACSFPQIGGVFISFSIDVMVQRKAVVFSADRPLEGLSEELCLESSCKKIIKRGEILAWKSRNH